MGERFYCLLFSSAVPPLRVAWPRSVLVVPSKKSSWPVGVPVAGATALTVAVKVTL